MPPTPSRSTAPATTTAPTSAPTTAGSSAASMSGASAARAARSQATMGNAAVAASLNRGTSVADQLPAELELQRAGVSFELPGNTALTGDWNQLETTGRTTVSIQVSGQDLRVRFWPPLNIDAQWPVSNVAWSGFTWDFSRGRMADVALENTQLGFSAQGTVREAVVSFANALLAGTPLARPGYDPRSDPDLAGTLRRVQGNVTTRPAEGKPGDLTAADVSGFRLNAEARTRGEIRAGAGDGGIQLPAGASLSVSVALAGNGATVGARAPEVTSVHVSSDNLVLESGGKPVAKLRSLRIDRGGGVDVTDFEPLGTLAEVGAGESLVRLLAVLAAVQGSGDPRIAANADIRPRVVDGIAEKQMEAALTEAVQALVRDHHDVLPGVDLRSVLGLAAPKS